MIIPKTEYTEEKIVVDLTGPEGNAFILLGTETYNFCYNDSGIWYGQKEDGGEYVTKGFSEFNDLYNFVLKND